jgi:uncharacterized protein
MASEIIIDLLKRYLNRLVEAKIPIKGLVLYGSHARGEAKPQSDIDVVALLDNSVRPTEIREVWTRMERLTLGLDARIETWPVTIHRFETDEVSPLVIAARREGLRIELPAA